MTNVRLANRYANEEKLIKNNQLVQALEHVEKTRDQYGSSDKALFHLDRGIVHFYNQNYDQAIADLAESDRIFEELYTKSISKGVGSFLFNDNLLDYDGADHENVLINLIKALAFINKGDPDGALVEIRRVHEKLQLLQVKYMKEIDELKNTNKKQKVEAGEYNFTDSSLARYLGYLLYRYEGSLDDARIDKEKWAKLWVENSNIYNYKAPDLNQFNLEIDNNLIPLNFLISTNFAPFKLAWELEATTTVDNDKDWSIVNVRGKNPTFNKTYFLNRAAFEGLNFKISIPKLQVRNQLYSSIQVTVDNQQPRQLDLIEDLDIIAVNNYKLNEFTRTLKHLTRSFVKALAANEVEKEAKKNKSEIWGNILSSIGKAAINSTEQADLRCWRLVPSKFYAGEFLLSPGQHQVKIDYLNANGTVAKTETFNYMLDKSKSLNLVNRYVF